MSKNTLFESVIMGMWQVSGIHGEIDHDKAIEEMYQYFCMGFKSWDLADHYGPAEDFIGKLRGIVKEREGEGALSDLKAFTKWVPTNPTTRWTLESDYGLKYVEGQIDISLKRMKVDKLDLLQFHWWDYQDDRLFSALDSLFELQRKGKIAHIGITNFDLFNLKRIVERGYKIVSNQVRFSLTDPRARKEMLDYCDEQGVKILAFGTIGSGFLSNFWLGKKEPGDEVLNRGQFIHKRLIDRQGGWDKFQKLLNQLNTIANNYGVSISNVASKFIMQQKSLPSVVIGARLSLSGHIQDNLRLNNFELSKKEFDTLDDNFLREGSELLSSLGDIGAEYRGVKL